jgi:membrane protein implicated in regulation of membrane protease activity
MSTLETTKRSAAFINFIVFISSTGLSLITGGFAYLISGSILLSIATGGVGFAIVAALSCIAIWLWPKPLEYTQEQIKTLNEDVEKLPGILQQPLVIANELLLYIRSNYNQIASQSDEQQQRMDENVQTLKDIITIASHEELQLNNITHLIRASTQHSIKKMDEVVTGINQTGLTLFATTSALQKNQEDLAQKNDHLDQVLKKLTETQKLMSAIASRTRDQFEQLVCQNAEIAALKSELKKLQSVHEELLAEMNISCKLLKTENARPRDDANSDSSEISSLVTCSHSFF